MLSIRHLMFSIAFIVEIRVTDVVAMVPRVREFCSVIVTPLFFLASGFFHNNYCFRQIRFFV
jgi:hypothetical protein